VASGCAPPRLINPEVSERFESRLALFLQAQQAGHPTLT
jgi:hypothetical protein